MIEDVVMIVLLEAKKTPVPDTCGDGNGLIGRFVDQLYLVLSDMVI